jgi:hypothetical protein
MAGTQQQTYRCRERGSVFLLAMMILIVILVLGASLIERSQTAVDRASARSRSTRAFHLAEAGIQKALWEFNQPDGWLTYAGDTELPLQGGTVDITVSPPPPDREVFTDSLVVVSTSDLPSPQGGRRHSCAIRVITHKDQNYFDYAIFGDQKVTIGNGTVTLTADSYTSDDGPYGGGNVGAAAGIGTNSTASDAVEILPQGEAHGDIFVGAGAADPSACVENNGTITGSISAFSAPVTLSSITSVPPEAVYLDNIILTGNDTLTLEEGVYWTRDMTISGKAQLICNGEVELYIDQSLDATPDIYIGGKGMANASGIPADFTLYVLTNVPTSIRLCGEGALYGGIYAPTADIEINSGEVYGSVIGRSVTLNGSNSHIHYDEALKADDGAKAKIRSWEVL